MDESNLPQFNSIDDLVEFFETHDMGGLDLPQAEFVVDIKKRTFLLAVDEALMKKLSKVARDQQTSTEELVNAWLEERVGHAA